MAEISMTPADAAPRITKHGFSGEVGDGDIRAASLRLDETGTTWEGKDLDPPTAPPEDVLDAVALMALQAAQGEEPAIVSERILHESYTYAQPAVDRLTRRIEVLLWPHGGRLVGYIA
jgi:hypothetical protein